LVETVPRQFNYSEYFPGIYHIADPLGVQFTLIILRAENKAVLFDCGYGFTDWRPWVNSLLKAHNHAPGDVYVIASHAHHDHILGARWADHFYIHADDYPQLSVYASRENRIRVLERMRTSGMLTAPFDEGSYIAEDIASRARKDLPCFTGIEVIPLPGHTPGSLVLYLNEYKLLLTADNWNPTTWVFFPEALPVDRYAQNMRRLLALDFEHVLCSHAGELMAGSRLRNYINGLSPETFASAEPVSSPYPQIETLLCHPEPGTSLVFRKPGSNL
jgi:glyoxylase-like metal-dependent hydrolase (beta-lactamase superfamily II)